MLVVLPTQHLSVMNAWDGLFGILGKIPFINKLQVFIIKKWYSKNRRFLSWPNIKAKQLIVPERIGNITPKEIAKEALFLLENNSHLKSQKQKLATQRGRSGATDKLSNLILKELQKI